MTSEASANLLSPPKLVRSIKEQEFLAIRHALPKTRVSHTILHENPSQDRHLGMKLSSVQHRRTQISNNFDLSMRTFVEEQSRKQRKWKREDDMRRANMNFPNFKPMDKRPSSMTVVYNSPVYVDKDEKDKVRKGPLLPYMTIRREKTEILSHRDRTVMTKLPTVIEVDDKKLLRYNTYCGTDFITLGVPVADVRFAKLADSLSPRVPTRLQHRHHHHHHRRRKKLWKYGFGGAYHYSDSDILSFSSEGSTPVSSADGLQRRIKGAGGGHSAKLVMPGMSRSRASKHGGPQLHQRELTEVIDTTKSTKADPMLQLQHTVDNNVK